MATLLFFVQTIYVTAVLDYNVYKYKLYSVQEVEITVS